MKWLISKQNSAWGIKKDGQGNQYYSHVIDFPDDTDNKNRDEFLNKEIFLTDDWKATLDLMPDTGYTIKDSNKTTFRIDMEWYPDETVDSMLNKDFAVCQEVVNGEKVYSFWAVEGRAFQNRQIIEYEAVRDWIFEKGINNLFRDDRQVKIERAHIRDLTGDNRWNIDMSSDNAVTESIEQFDESCYFPTKTEKILIDYFNDIEISDSNLVLYYWNQDSDNIYKIDIAKKIKTVIVNKASNQGQMRWFTVFKTSKQNYLVWAYYKWVTGSDYELVFNCQDEAGNFKKQSFYTTDSENNRKWYYNEKSKQLIAIISDEPNIKIAYLHDWVQDFESSIKTEIIKFSDENTYLNSVSIACHGGNIYISYISRAFVNNQYWAYYLNIQKNGFNKKFGIYSTWSAGFDGDSWLYVSDNYIYVRFWLISNDTTIKINKMKTINIKSLDEIKDENTNLWFNHGVAFKSITNNYYNDYSWFYNEGDNINKYNNNYCVVYSTNGIISADIEGNKHCIKLNGAIIDCDNSYYFYISVAETKTEVNITKQEVNELLNNKAFAIVTCQLKDNTLKLGDSTTDNDFKFTEPTPITLNVLGTNIEQNYFSFLLPFEKISYEGAGVDITQFKTVYPIISKSPYVYNIRLQPFAIFPAGKWKYTVLGNGDNWVIEVREQGSGDFKTKSFTPVEVSSSLGKTKFLFKNEVNAFDNETTIKSINNANDYDKNIFKDFIINNLAKLHKNPFCLDYLKTVNGLKMLIYPQVLTNKYNIQMSYTWGHDTNHLIFKIKDLDNPNGIYNSNYTYGLLGQEINNFEFILTNEAYNNYMINNRSQLEQRSRRWEQEKGFTSERRIINIIKSIAGGVGAGTVAGVKGGGPLGALAGTATGLFTAGIGIAGNDLSYREQMASIENNIQMQASMLSDLKSAPNTLKGNGDDMNGVITKTSLSPILVHDELWPTLKDDIGNYFNMFGSKMNNKPRNINEFLGNKYHFNFIQAQSAFENYKESVPMNNLTRQITDKSLSEGITVWHYRDKRSFKGIKNWNVNNVDIDTLTDIKINTENIEVDKYETKYLDIKIKHGLIENVSCISDNEQIAKCKIENNNILIDGINFGKTFITVKTVSGFKYKINVVVTDGKRPPKYNINIDKSNILLTLGKEKPKYNINIDKSDILLTIGKEKPKYDIVINKNPIYLNGTTKPDTIDLEIELRNPNTVYELSFNGAERKNILIKNWYEIKNWNELLHPIIISNLTRSCFCKLNKKSKLLVIWKFAEGEGSIGLREFNVSIKQKTAIIKIKE